MEVIREVVSRHAGLPVLVLSMYDEAVYAERVLAAGASGYIMKKEASTSIVQAIRRVLDGSVYLTDKMTDNLLGKLAGKSAQEEFSSLVCLTDRELEVFQLIGRGFKTGEIADRLSLSAKTISTYRERIKDKLNLKSSAELIRHAVRWQETEES
jgi:DNA-binding NarL/FixJ family response regulator